MKPVLNTHCYFPTVLNFKPQGAQNCRVKSQANLENLSQKLLGLAQTLVFYTVGSEYRTSLVFEWLKVV